MSFFGKYGKKCDYVEMGDRISKIMYNLTNEFVGGEYNNIYKERFPTSECINCFHKTKKCILKLICRNLTVNPDEMLLINLSYNITT